MIRRLLIWTSIAVAAGSAWMACVGDDPVIATAGGDAGTGMDGGVSDAAATDSASTDALADAAELPDAACDAGPVKTPTNGTLHCYGGNTCGCMTGTTCANYCCESLSTCFAPPGEQCTGNVVWACEDKSHCAAGVCCMTSDPASSTTTTCPIAFGKVASSCQTSCAPGVRRMCSPADPCPAPQQCIAVTAKQIDDNDAGGFKAGICF